MLNSHANLFNFQYVHESKCRDSEVFGLIQSEQVIVFSTQILGFIRPTNMFKCQISNKVISPLKWQQWIQLVKIFSSQNVSLSREQSQ